MKLLIAAGGTGGHLFPGISVAETLKVLDPKGEVVFIGSERGLEAEILRREGYPFETLLVGRIKGEGWRRQARTVWELPKSLLRSRKILRRHRPEAVLGVGGYSSGPLLLAAALRRIPSAILEPNVIPGFTNRILGRFVDRVFVAFPETERFFSKRKVRLTGTPVRRSFRQTVPTGGRDFTVLVFGGSQGATALNRAMTEVLPLLKKGGRPFRVLHQTGLNDFEGVKAAYLQAGISHEVFRFIEEMAGVYRKADLVVSRAGASTIAELIETRTPSILVPYPYAADDHQRFNALSLVRAGGAEMILNQDLDRLGERLLYYESHREELGGMRQRLACLRQEPAAERVARECLEMVKGESGRE